MLLCEFRGRDLDGLGRYALSVGSHSSVSGMKLFQPISLMPKQWS